MTSKFFTFRQNNPGGYQIINETVAEYIIIEATNVKEANDIFSKITENFNQGCSCGICSGERWRKFDEDYDEDEGMTIPMIGNFKAEDYRYKGIFDNDDLRTIIIYYLDGAKNILNYKE